MALYWEEWNRSPSNRCTFTWSFTPQAGRSYTAKFDISGSKCFVDLQDSSGSVSQYFPVRLRQRSYRAPWDGAGSWCHPN